MPEGEQFLFVRSDGEAIQAEFVDPDADVAKSPSDLAAGQAAPSALAAMILKPKHEDPRAPGGAFERVGGLLSELLNQR